MKAALWGLSVAGAVAGALVLVVAGFGRRGGSSARPAVLLGDLETGYPEALNDLMDHVNITDKKSWMTGIYQKAKGAKLLHPLADIDPFTGQALDGNNYEALLRSHATKAIADQMDDAAKADMASAQQVCTTEPPQKEMPLGHGTKFAESHGRDVSGLPALDQGACCCIAGTAFSPSPCKLTFCTRSLHRTWLCYPVCYLDSWNPRERDNSADLLTVNNCRLRGMLLGRMQAAPTQSWISKTTRARRPRP
jgi:hypothetical protein